MLSQDEIDALLKGTDDEEDLGLVAPLIDDYLSIMEQDALGEIGNISFGSSATALSTLLNQKVDITTPTVSLVERERLQEEFPHPYVAVQVNYTVGFSGLNLLVIKQSDAAIIADLMLGGDGTNPSELLGEIQLSAAQEAMNQMMGSAATSMSTIFNKKVDISPPSIELLDMIAGQGRESFPPDQFLVKISFRLKIGELIDSNIMQLLPVDFAKELVKELLGGSSESEVPQVTEQQTYEQAAVAQSSSVSAPVLEQQVQQSAIDLQKMPSGVPMAATGASVQTAMSGYQSASVPHEPNHFRSAYGQPAQPVNVQPASFSSFQPYQMAETEAQNLNLLLDIPLQVTVELGRTQRSVKEILELSNGSIIELDKLAGEPVDILVNSRLIAKGEVVVIDENFGVRVTDIISQSDRLKKLR